MHIFHKITDHYFDTNQHSCDIKIYKIFFNVFALKKYSIKEKFILLDHFLNRNMFLTKVMHEELLTIFGNIQKKYLVLQRFIFFIKYKKSKIVIHSDLSLNTISENDKNVICIYQNNHRYLFHMRELIQLVNTSLIHSEYFFSCPLVSKNPYNNIILNKSTLYNIYFFMRFKTMYFSEILHHYFKQNFHLSDFQEKNEYVLRKYAIDDFLKNDSTKLIGSYVDSMIQEHNHIFTSRSIHIHKDFPLEQKVNIMKPYVKLYLLSKFSLSYQDKVCVKKELSRKLLRFYHFNPRFGRKNIKINYIKTMTRKYIKSRTIQFLEDHVCFNEDKTEEFLDSHKRKITNHDDYYNDEEEEEHEEPNENPNVIEEEGEEENEDED